MAKIKLKRGLSSNITSVNLDEGEPAFCTDTGKLYIGDGRNNVLVNPTGGVAESADRLSIPRNVSISGDISAPNVPFDGTQDVTLNASLPMSGVTSGTYTKVTVNPKGIVTGSGVLAEGDLPSISANKIVETTAKKFLTDDERNKLGTIQSGAETNQNAFSNVKIGTSIIQADQKMDTLEIIAGDNISLSANTTNDSISIAVTGLGGAATKNVGTNAGDVVGVNGDGKIDLSLIPASAITETFVVNSQQSMLALNAQAGDVAIRTDINKSFILKQIPATTLSNWQELLSPTDAVQSVNGKTGVVVITKADVGLGNAVNESKATMFDSPAFTGVPTTTTPVTSDNSTKIASTAFVKAQGYLTSASVVDGGTF